MQQVTQYLELLKQFAQCTQHNMRTLIDAMNTIYINADAETQAEMTRQHRLFRDSHNAKN